ncbi:MAG: phosphatase PAP2 family protein [Candidatus Electrothrix sp. AR3]|nr:phosphatase PAP2 family protein [Candidatus Electrothrix sp. AR3]
MEEAVLRQGGILGELIRLNYEVASLWNACPSFHVASPWFLYRTLGHYVPRRHLLFFFLALSIMASTIFIRIHYIADIIGGILVSELVFRFVLRRQKEAEHLGYFCKQ